MLTPSPSPPYPNPPDNKSFMTLAGYIGVTKSPQNSANESIAMTAPVSKSGMDGDTQMMSFILPASYTSISAVPAPTDPAVTVVELPPQYGAVHKFSGWVTDSQARSKLSSLLVHLNDDGVTIPVTECNWELWQYNPPFTIPWCRRNEVFVELTKEQAEGLGK